MKKPTKSLREDSDQSRRPSSKAVQSSLRVKKQVQEKTDQIVRMPSLIGVFVGRKCDCWFCHDVAEIFSVSVKHLLA